jgi:hypothetical protein
MDAYEYEVFLSYKRGKIPEEWLNETFLDQFQDKLGAALGGKIPKIFIDRQEIQPGSAWPDVLCDTLSKSICLVAILSPFYFNSDWCLREFSAMYHRQLELRRANKLGSNGAVITPLLSQGPTDSFPEFISGIQLLDYSKYYKVGGAFRNSSQYLDFQDKIETDAKKTALMIKNAPPWQKEFADPKWLKGPYDFHKNLNLDVIQSKPSWGR